jgi:hypothetical protein
MTFTALFRELHRRDRALALGGALMLAGLAVVVVIAPFDTRLVLGINPWIKPMKFLVSIAIFLWTMAWFMAEADPRHARRVAVIRWTMLIAMFGEIALIALQAARGTTSHFNVATPFDKLVFNVMGAMIVANSVAAGVFIGTLRRDPSPARAGYLWGLRLGLVIFVLGSFQGFFMVAHMGRSVPLPDGGRTALRQLVHDGRRPPHRALHRLHALQVLPLAGFLLDLTRAATASARSRAVSGLALAWLVAMAGALALALAGWPLPAGL